MTIPVRAPAEIAGRRAIWLAIAALVMAFMLPPAALVLAVFAVVAGIRAVPQLKADGRPVGTAVAGIAVSSVALLISATASALQLYLMDEYSAYSECMKGAGTVSSQGECFAEFRKATERKLPEGVLRFLGEGQP
ncbi:DUF4190 domain-containing protein [Thermoactinospora rubra]|uniref:DUF4190 domain-containing protein n=1 Tax=Thermoactinospora rubra TaxID=1088767 RepID=UPI000A1163D5|nr:DUF4190 domain-containing protein [Thermoactinospora rubra]